MWEISEADTNYFVLSTSVIKRSRKHCSSQHYSLKVSALFIFALLIYIYTHTHTLYHSTNILEHASILLKFLVNKHVFMKLLSLSKKLSPHNFEIW